MDEAVAEIRVQCGQGSGHSHIRGGRGSAHGHVHGGRGRGHGHFHGGRGRGHVTFTADKRARPRYTRPRPHRVRRGRRRVQGERGRGHDRFHTGRGHVHGGRGRGHIQIHDGRGRAHGHVHGGRGRGAVTKGQSAPPRADGHHDHEPATAASPRRRASGGRRGEDGRGPRRHGRQTREMRGLTATTPQTVRREPRPVPPVASH